MIYLVNDKVIYKILKPYKLLFWAAFILLLNCCSNPESNRISFELVGDWTLTENKDESRFTDYWRFEEDGNFCELKFVADGVSGMKCDEAGMYSISNGSILTISIVEEDGIMFAEPHIQIFSMKRQGEFILLFPVAKIETSYRNPEVLNLRLKEMY